MYALTFIICLLASLVGAVCGIGGGVIIKPLLDAFGILGMAELNFLSGCTVLSMTAYSVIRSKAVGESYIRADTSLPLAVGAAMGGILGKQLFEWILAISGQNNLVGVVQSASLLAVTAGTLTYIVCQGRIYTIHVKNKAFCFLIGAVLGLVSSFLGIGGGPVNLVVLYYFFSMETKEATENSLYIIFFSQSSSLLMSILTGTIPIFSFKLLFLMIAGGIGGGICGRKWNKRLDAKAVEKLLIGIMLFMILVNSCNLYKFM